MTNLGHQVLRRQATVLERQDEQERMRDPFWEDAEAERRRNKEHNRRTLSAEQLGELAEEDAAATRDRQLRVKTEQTALRKEAQQAKRATLVGRQHVPNHRRASGDVSAVDDLLASMHKVSALAEEPADGEAGAAPAPSVEAGEISPAALRAIAPAQEHDLAEVDGPDPDESCMDEPCMAVDAPLGAAAIAPAQEHDLAEVDGFSESESESAADPASAEGAPEGAPSQFTRKESCVGAPTSAAMDALNADFESNPDEAVGALPKPTTVAGAAPMVGVTVADAAAKDGPQSRAEELLLGLLGIAEEGARGSVRAAPGESAEDGAPFGRKQSVYHGFASNPADPADPVDPVDGAAQEAPTPPPPPMNRFAGQQKNTAKTEPEPEPESEPEPSSPGKRRFKLFTF